MDTAPSGFKSPYEKLPADIALHRARIFALAEPVNFSKTAWDTFWPFVDNMWSMWARDGGSNTNHVPETGIRRMYGECRLHREMRDTRENQPNRPPPQRNRKRRENIHCPAKFKMTISADGNRIMEMTSTEEHNHDIDLLDKIKRNSGVRNLVYDEYFAGWEAGAIFAFLKETSVLPDGRNQLEEAGGKFLDKREITNLLQMRLKKQYPDQNITELKKQAEKYKSYLNCGVKGCQAPSFPDAKELAKHKREVHGLQSHDHTGKIPCPEKSCWRHKTSKGFKTMTALQEHQRTYHGAGMPSGAGVIIDPQMQALMDAVRSHEDYEGQMGMPNFTLPPVTPDSDGYAPHLPNIPSSQQPPSGMNTRPHDPLTAAQRKDMEARLQLLQQQKANIEVEIQKLRTELYASYTNASRPSNG